MTKKARTVLFLLTILALSCEKPRTHPLTNVDVDIYLNINSAENSSLRIPGGSKELGGGVNGVILYRTSTNAFTAFDMTCPHEDEENCIVQVDGALVTCPCCGSVFSLLDGSLISGPSQWPLKAYYVNFDGVYVIITN